jgi:hypothetical protein
MGDSNLTRVRRVVPSRELPAFWRFDRLYSFPGARVTQGEGEKGRHALLHGSRTQ